MNGSNTTSVKPLDWKPADDGGIWAYNSVTGHYKVIAFDGEWIAVGLGPYPSQEMAKGACFQKHERAIHSQIVEGFTQ